MRGASFGRAAGLAFAVTFGVEALQFAVVTGRDSSFADLLANTLGGLAGWGLWQSHAWRPTGRPAQILALLGGVAWGWSLGVPSWAMAPDETRVPTWGQVRPVLRGLVPFQGPVLSAVFDGRAFESGRLSAASASAGEVQGGAVTLETVAVIEAPVRARSMLARVVDDSGQTVVEVGVSRGAVWGHRGQRGHRLGVRETGVALPLAMAFQPGDTIAVRFVADAGRQSLSLRVGDSSTEAVLTPRPAHGWAALLPGGHALAPGPSALGVAWLLVPAMLVGYWAARAPRGAVAWTVTAVVAVLAGLAWDVRVVTAPVALDLAVAASGYAVVLAIARRWTVHRGS
jgi:hypothetical protein